jgi:TRAP-type C4-dicarboxylate transport system permease small subunit
LLLSAFMETIAKVNMFLLELYYRLLKFLLTLLMSLMVVPVSLQILSRYTGIVPRYIWTEEVARFCFVWIVMIGSMIAVRDETHFNVDLLPHPETQRQKGISNLIVHMAMMVMAVVFAWYGYDFAKFGFIQQSEMSGINMLSIYISFPLAGVTWGLFLMERMVDDLQLIVGKSRKLQS